MQTAVSSTPKGNGRIVCFDLIRLFSCLCVTIVHFNATVSGWNGTFVYPNSVTPNFFVHGRIYLGGIGVSLFFMLSGATLMYSYKGKILSFFRKRIRSIFPMFYCAWTVAFLYDFFFYKGMNVGNGGQWLFTLLGMDGYLATLGVIGYQYYKVGEWFLGCLLLLYLLFPLYYACLTKHEIPTILCTIALYALLMNFSPDFLTNRTSILFYMRIPEIMLGMLFVKHKLYDKPAVSAAIGMGIFLISYLFRSFVDDLTFCVSFCVMLFGMLTFVSSMTATGVLQNGMKKLADLTYPIFLVHHWLSYVLVRGFPLEALPRRDRYMLLIAYLLFTLILSYLLQLGAGKLMAKVDHATSRYRQFICCKKEGEKV